MYRYIIHSWSYKGFKGISGKSDIGLFAFRVIWNHAYSPIKRLSNSFPWERIKDHNILHGLNKYCPIRKPSQLLSPDFMTPLYVL